MASVKGKGIGLIGKAQTFGKIETREPPKVGSQLIDLLLKKGDGVEIDPDYGDWDVDVPYFQGLYDNIQQSVYKAGRITPAIRKNMNMAEAALVRQADQKKLSGDYLTRARKLYDAHKIDDEQFKIAKDSYDQFVKVGNPMLRGSYDLPELVIKPEEIEYDYLGKLESLDIGIENITIEEGEVTETTKGAVKRNIDTKFKAFLNTPEGEYAMQDLKRRNIPNREKYLKDYLIAGLDSQYKRLLDESYGGLTLDFGRGKGSYGGWEFIYDKGVPQEGVTPFTPTGLTPPTFGEKIVFTAKEGREPTFTSLAISYDPQSEKKVDHDFLRGITQEVKQSQIAKRGTGLVTSVGFKPNTVYKDTDGNWVVLGEAQYTNDSDVRKFRRGAIVLEEGLNKKEFEEQFLGGTTIEEFMEKSGAEGKINTSGFKGVPEGGF